MAAAGNRRFRVVVTRRTGGTRMLYLIPGRGYSYRRGKHGRARMTAVEAEQAKRWAQRRLARHVRVVAPRQWPFLQLVDGAAWPTNRALLRALNTTGRRRRRVVRIVSGLRTPREAWALRDRWNRSQHGGPPANLAAPCCSKYGRATTIHSWSQCGKDPWSNHADGNAADCGTVSGRTGNYQSLANDSRAARIFRSLGGCFPVVDPWEPWHAEMR